MVDEPLTQTVKLQVGNYRYPVQMTLNGDRIEFQFRYNKAIMDEIKSMADARWHGRDPHPRKIWSILDCERNRFQLAWLQGENPYEWFEQPVKEFSYDRPLMLHQCDMTNCGLTYHYQLWAAEMGLGKTLSAIEVAERSGHPDWWWVAPRAALKAVERELRKWESRVSPTLMTYEGLVKLIANWTPGTAPPHGVVLDESQRIKTASTKRSISAFHLATNMRSHWGYDSFVIEMSGTPSPKSPVDWWHQAEVACPGFLREGSPSSFQRRLAFMEQVTTLEGQKFWKQVGWRDDTRKCNLCGHYAEYEAHDKVAAMVIGKDYHPFQESVNEVELLYERLRGLVVIKSKKDCLDLPDKHYRQIRCQPKPSILRAAKTIFETSPNTVTGMTLLRELSDGFQYREEPHGKKTCPHCEGRKEVKQWVDPADEDRVFSQIDFLDPELQEALIERTILCPTCNGNGEIDNMVRVALRVPSPKIDVLKDLLDECDEQGRIVIFAGFTGAIDQCCELAQKENWTVIRVDGRGWSVIGPDGSPIKRDALDLWADLSDTEETRRVAFIAHPGSGGVGLTLTESSMVVFYSNDFNPEYRAQAEDRIHRPGMDYAKGATIVDIFHLPSDDRVYEILKDNRRLELMSMGEFRNVLDVVNTDYDY